MIAFLVSIPIFFGGEIRGKISSWGVGGGGGGSPPPPRSFVFGACVLGGVGGWVNGVFGNGTLS